MSNTTIIDITAAVADWPVIDGWSISPGTDWCAAGYRVRVGSNCTAGYDFKVGDWFRAGSGLRAGNWFWAGDGFQVGDDFEAGD